MRNQSGDETPICQGLTVGKLPMVTVMVGGMLMAFNVSASAQAQTRYNTLIRPAVTSGATATSKPVPVIDFNTNQPNPIQSEAAVPQLPPVPISGNQTQYVPGQQYTSDPQYAQADVYSASTYGGRYLVYVDSDSPTILQQVRTVEPGAFFKNIGGRTVIQTGSFNNFGGVQQQLNLLGSYGFTGVNYTTADGSSNIGGTTIPAPAPGTGYTPAPAPIPGPTPGTGVYPAPGNQAILRPAIPYGATAYYVVVPGGIDQLPNLQQKIIQLGADISAVQQRVAPRGPHVAVGPFADRSSAETWTNYFRDYGLDARVYYGR